MRLLTQRAQITFNLSRYQIEHDEISSELGWNQNLTRIIIEFV